MHYNTKQYNIIQNKTIQTTQSNTILYNKLQCNAM